MINVADILRSYYPSIVVSDAINNISDDLFVEQRGSAGCWHIVHEYNLGGGFVCPRSVIYVPGSSDKHKQLCLEILNNIHTLRLLSI